MVYCSVILNFKMTVRSETVLIVVIADAILDAIFLTAVTAIRNFAQRFMYEVPALLFDVARLFVLAINLWILARNAEKPAATLFISSANALSVVVNF